MRIFKSIVLTGLLALCPQVYGQEDGFFGGITRWGTKPVEPGSVDSLKKLTTELAELKARLKLLEDNQSTFNVSVKNQFQSMNDSMKMMQAHCEKLQQESTSYKATITQTGAVVPVVKPASEEGAQTKAIQDLINKRSDELAATMENLTKLNLQVQANTRDVADLKKKYDTNERDLIQAQNDIGKLQQEFARFSTRPAPSTEGTGGRQSMSLPLPPDSQATAPARSTLSTVKLVNTYPTPVTIIVDGQFYTLPSNNSLSLNKNPGYFTYEVPGIQANTLRNLGTAETMTIQIYPR